jgi:hypothetical protein
LLQNKCYKTILGQGKTWKITRENGQPTVIGWPNVMLTMLTLTTLNQVMARNGVGMHAYVLAKIEKAGETRMD